MGLAVIAVTFVLSTPYFFLDFTTALESLRTEGRSTHLGADGLSPLGNLGWYLTTAIPNTVTWPQYILIIMGSCIILWRREILSLLILAYVVIFLTAIFFSPLHWARWIIPTLPILALLAVSALDFFSRRVLKSVHIQSAALGLCVIVISAWPAYQSILHDIRESSPSTCVLAREWMIGHLPAKSHIAQEWYTAPLDKTHFTVTEKFSLAQNSTLDSYVSEDYDYLVVSSAIYQRYFSEPERYREEVNFYNTLFQNSYLLGEFIPTDTQGGPTIRIYELKSIP